MEEGRAGAHDHGGDEQPDEAIGKCQAQNAGGDDDQRQGQTIGIGLEIAAQAENRLEETGGDLLAQRKQATSRRDRRADRGRSPSRPPP